MLVDAAACRLAGGKFSGLRVHEAVEVREVDVAEFHLHVLDFSCLVRILGICLGLEIAEKRPFSRFVSEVEVKSLCKIS